MHDDHVLPLAAIKAECRKRGFRLGFGNAPKAWVLVRRQSRATLAFENREALAAFLLRQPLQVQERM